METGLKGNVVVITGASGGIGAGVAKQFAEEGARLVLQYRTPTSALQKLTKQAEPTRCAAVRADLTSESETAELFSTAVKRFGRVDTLIANAASWETRDVPLQEMSLAQWHKTLDGVLTTTFLTLREFFKVVAVQGRGNAVLIGSTAAVFGEAGHADYAAAKSGVAFGLTRSLKNEIARLAPHTKRYCGGRINCICPGWTVVPRLQAKLSDQGMIRKTTATMALPQLGRPEDVANAAVFLSSDRLARHITGQVLVIAGGMEGRWLWNPEEIAAEWA